MREIRPYGSEGGGAVCSPYPYSWWSGPPAHAWAFKDNFSQLPPRRELSAHDIFIKRGAAARHEKLLCASSQIKIQRCLNSDPLFLPGRNDSTAVEGKNFGQIPLPLPKDPSIVVQFFSHSGQALNSHRGKELQ